MVLAPMGSGKSTYIKNLGHSKILDGDTVLENEKIPNKNYYWYPTTHMGSRTEVNEQERYNIFITFEKYLQSGYTILYSGNPLIMPFDYLVAIDPEIRWTQLLERAKRGEWSPSTLQFDREENAYREAMSKVSKDKVYSNFQNIPF